MEKKPDIFDRIISWPVMAPVRPLWQTYKEPLLYLLFGGLTTLLSIVLFWAFTQPLGIPVLVANFLGWIVCVLFDYVTNRTWVFQDKAVGFADILRECGLFVLGRVSTLVLEEGILWTGIDLLGINTMMVKVFTQALVIVGNYFFSKLLVFKSKTQRITE